MLLLLACAADDSGATSKVDSAADAYPLPDLDWSDCALSAPRDIVDAEDLWKTVDPFVDNVWALAALDDNFESVANDYCPAATDGDATTWYAPCLLAEGEFMFREGSYRTEAGTITYDGFVHDDLNGHWEADGSWRMEPIIEFSLTMDLEMPLQGIIEVDGTYEETDDVMRSGGYARTTGAFIEPDFSIPDGDFCMSLDLVGRAGSLVAHSANDVGAVYGEVGCGRLYVDGVDVGPTCLPWG